MSNVARGDGELQALADSRPDHVDATMGDAARQNAEPNYDEAYDPKSFWKKVAAFAKKAGKKVIYQALVLYFCLRDPDTPRWVKASIVGALGYFILPADAIPDAIPFVGFSDDLGVLAAAVGYLATHIKPEQRRKGEGTLKTWFG